MAYNVTVKITYKPNEIYQFRDSGLTLAGVSSLVADSIDFVSPFPDDPINILVQAELQQDS